MRKVATHRKWRGNDCDKLPRFQSNRKLIELSCESKNAVEWGCAELSEREENPKAHSGTVAMLCNFVFARLLNEEGKANSTRRMIHKRRAWESFLRKLSVKNFTRLQFAGYHRFVHTVGTRISLPWNHINFSSPQWEKGKVFPIPSL